MTWCDCAKEAELKDLLKVAKFQMDENSEINIFQLRLALLKFKRRRYRVRLLKN